MPSGRISPAKPGRRWTTRLGQAAAHPAALAIVLIDALTWIVFDRRTFDFNAVATLIVWVMATSSSVRAGAIRWRFMPSPTSCCGPTKRRGRSSQRSMRRSPRPSRNTAMKRYEPCVKPDSGTKFLRQRKVVVKPTEAPADGQIASSGGRHLQIPPGFSVAARQPFAEGMRPTSLPTFCKACSSRLPVKSYWHNDASNLPPRSAMLRAR